MMISRAEKVVPRRCLGVLGFAREKLGVFSIYNFYNHNIQENDVIFSTQQIMIQYGCIYIADLVYNIHERMGCVVVDISYICTSPPRNSGFLKGVPQMIPNDPFQ